MGGRFTDPYSSEEQIYECVECGVRITASHRQGRCDECNGKLRNLSVPRD